MIIYSVTVSLSPEIEEDWLNWMTNEHIDDVMNTNYFIEYRMTKVIEGHEKGTINYNIQYLCESIDQLNKYQEEAAGIMQQKHNARYKGKFVAFRTILKVIE